MQTLLQSVASGDDEPYYYYAPDGAALEDIFEEIGDFVAETYISK